MLCICVRRGRIWGVRSNSCAEESSQTIPMDALTYPWILGSAGVWGISSIRQLHSSSSSRRDLGPEALHSKYILQTPLMPLLAVSWMLLMAPLGRIHCGNISSVHRWNSCFWTRIFSCGLLRKSGWSDHIVCAPAHCATAQPPSWGNFERQVEDFRLLCFHKSSETR